MKIENIIVYFIQSFNGTYRNYYSRKSNRASVVWSNLNRFLGCIVSLWKIIALVCDRLSKMETKGTTSDRTRCFFIRLHITAKVHSRGWLNPKRYFQLGTYVVGFPFFSFLFLSSFLYLFYSLFFFVPL